MKRSRNLAARAAHWSAGHRKTAIFGWLAFVVIAFMVGNAVGKNMIQGADQFSGESGAAERTLYDAGLRPNTEHLLIQSKQLEVGDPEFTATIEDATARLSRTEDVRNVASPLTGDAPVSVDRHSALVSFEITGDSLEAAKRLDPTKEAVSAVQEAHPELRVEQFGNVSSNKELNDTFASDLAKAELLSFPLTLLILIIAFGALVAALVPLLLGITTVMAALGLIALPSHLSPIDGNIQSVILLIGLAVSVDYSLFYLRREREERAAGRSERSALEVAAATSGRAVLISGLTVIAAMAGMFLTGDKTFISFAQGTILVVAIAIVSSLTVLPAVLAWLGDRVEKGRIPFLGRKRRPAGQSRFWSALVDRVMRRPWLAILVAGGALVALSIPAFNMNIAVTTTDDLPPDLAVVKTFDRLREAFPAEAVTVDVAIKADDVRTGAAAAAISDLRAQAEGSLNVLQGTEVDYSKDGTVALVSIPTEGSGNDEQSTAALDEIRGEIVPATVGSVEGATVNVSGSAAQSKDFRDLVSDRLPLVFAFVFSLAFLLLLFTFRSIVIPIKAILLNLLSVGAAYGVLVLVFQDGHGESLLGFTSNGGVTSWLPLFLFVILFGLSMDYHVFILSRVRELYLRGMSTDEAVKRGISTTAGTVTSAAVVMVVVFSVFVTLSFLDFKQMGVGLAVAVLIDATIVRGVLMPASMKVLGDWNWYLPSWLEWLPRVGSEEDAIPPFEPEAPEAAEGRQPAPTPA
ncbi:MAG TPA: MMPL family transporter [Thermoleophilaceae bacterium]|nr:MMPL family transporter [Thermoleophilaceae bacterium]